MRAGARGRAEQMVGALAPRALTVAVAAGLVVAGLGGGCSSSEGGSAPTTSSAPAVTSGPTEAELDRELRRLWDLRADAIVEGDEDALAEVAVDPALASDRGYWIEYLPRTLLRPSERPPDVRSVDVLGIDASGRRALLHVQAGPYLQSRFGGTSVLVVMSEATSGGWKLEAFIDWGTDVHLELPTGTPSLLTPEGERLIDAYEDELERAETDREWPEESAFRSGPFTTGLVAAIETWRISPDWLVDTPIEAAAELGDGLRLSVGDESDALHCRVEPGSASFSSIDGRLMTPAEALGDFEVMVGSGRAAQYRLNRYSSVCIRMRKGGDPEVVVWKYSRVSAEKVL